MRPQVRPSDKTTRRDYQVNHQVRPQVGLCVKPSGETSEEAIGFFFSLFFLLSPLALVSLLGLRDLVLRARAGLGFLLGDAARGAFFMH